MWCKNNGCCHYDKDIDFCKLKICWMATSEYHHNINNAYNDKLINLIKK